MIMKQGYFVFPLLIQTNANLRQGIVMIDLVNDFGIYCGLESEPECAKATSRWAMGMPGCSRNSCMKAYRRDKMKRKGSK